MTERGLVFEDFADKVDEVFVISQDGLPAIPLTLKEAELLNPAIAPPGGMRPPFSLTFFARDPRIFPQSLYRMEHQELRRGDDLFGAGRQGRRGRDLCGDVQLRSCSEGLAHKSPAVRKSRRDGAQRRRGFVRHRPLFSFAIAGKGHAGRLGIVRGRAPHRVLLLAAAGHAEMRQHRRPHRLGKLAIVEDEAAAQVPMVEDGAADGGEHAGAIVFGRYRSPSAAMPKKPGGKNCGTICSRARASATPAPRPDRDKERPRARRERRAGTAAKRAYASNRA